MDGAFNKNQIQPISNLLGAKPGALPLRSRKSSTDHENFYRSWHTLADARRPAMRWLGPKQGVYFRKRFDSRKVMSLTSIFSGVAKTHRWRGSAIAKRLLHQLSLKCSIARVVP